MPKYYQVRTIPTEDGGTMKVAFRFNQFSGERAGGYPDPSGGWNEGFKVNANNDVDGTPIGTPDADLDAAYTLVRLKPVDGSPAGSPPAVDDDEGYTTYEGEVSVTATKSWP